METEIKPQRFTKRPVTIEAIQWTGENTKAMFDFVRDGQDRPSMSCGHPNGMAAIVTLEDGEAEWSVKHWASPGDWIIKGVKDEFYPCKPDIFEMTYMPEDGSETR